VRHMSRLAVGIVLSVGWVAVPSASGSTVSNGLIAFSTHFVLPFGDRGVGAQIFTVTPNGGAPHQLTHVASDQDAAAPSWSPSGARIVYESDVTGDMQIWTMRADGSNQHLLFRDRGWDDFTPHYSPDGSRVVFARCNSSLFYCTIATISAAGGSLHVLTGGHWVDADPTFSPSGRWIAFDSSRGGYLSAVWVMTASGQKLHRLTAPRLEAFWPSWSPDGTHIAFTRDCCLPFSQVFVMDSNGTNVLQLTHVPLPHQAGFATYSPDGQKLVLISDLAYPNQDGNDIYTVNASTGQGLTRVTRTQPDAVLSSWGPQR
jgi:Tol biopolymer transport system component